MEGGNCTICGKYFTLLHMHHTIPQALGGKDSMQIPLCAQCHNLLHANAEYICSNLRGGKSRKRQFWTASQEISAGPYLEILVKAMMSAPPPQKEWVMRFPATTALHSALNRFKKDSSLTSLEDAVVLALSNYLDSKGYLHERQTKRGKESTSRPQSVSDLW